MTSSISWTWTDGAITDEVQALTLVAPAPLELAPPGIVGKVNGVITATRRIMREIRAGDASGGAMP